MSAAEQEALQLREAARDHMRAARRHRRRAKELMEQLDTLVAAFAKRGIEININQPRDRSGGPSGNPRNRTEGATTGEA